MNFSDVLKARTSIRDFKDRQIDRELLVKLVEEAQTAPSWANSQPWKVYIATGETMKTIREGHVAKNEKGIAGKSDIPVMSREDWGTFAASNMASWFEEVSSKMPMEKFGEANAKLWNAPAMAYITIPKASPAWSVYDAGAFAHTLTLSAADKGIDSMVAYENVKYPEEIRAEFDIPEDERIVIGIALGYRSDNIVNAYRSSRLPVDDILTIR